MTHGIPGATRYPDAPIDTIAAGNSFEDFVCDKLSEMGLILRTYKSKEYQFNTGENKIGWEIKLDNGVVKYKHLSIEVAEKTRNDPSLRWTPSGIFRNDNSWLYIHGNKELFWILFKPAVVRFAREKNPQIHESHGTVRKFYLEYSDADRLGIRIGDEQI